MRSVRQKFWAIGGGKDGVGKSFLTASMGVALARMGKSVIVVDADPGTATLHTYFGMKRPACTLLDILENRASQEEGVLQTREPGLRMLSCARHILSMANPQFAQRDKILRFMADLTAEYILVDLGPGTSADVLDFLNISDEGIVVVSPEPAAMDNAYGFVKRAICRKIQRKYATDDGVTALLKAFQGGTGSSKPKTMLDFYDLLFETESAVAESVAELVDGYRPVMVVNMAGSEQDQRIAEIIQSAAKKFLNVDVRFCGLVASDPTVRQAVAQMTPLDFNETTSIAVQHVKQIVLRLLNCSLPAEATAQADWNSPVPLTPAMGFNDNLEFRGKEVHVQTEDLGYAGRCITTQVFYGGHIIHSARSEYPATVRDQGDRNQVIELMRKQHFGVMRDIESKMARNLPPA